MATTQPNAGEVRVAGTGKIWLAPEKTVFPTDLSATPGAGWVDMGYVTEDGVTFNFNRETEDLNAWQGDRIRVLSLKEPKDVQFSLMQTSSDVLKAAFGGGTVSESKAASGSGQSATKSEQTFTPPKKGENATHALIVEFEDGGIKYQYRFPRVQQQGEITFTLTRAGALTYPITFGVLDNDPQYTVVTNDPALVKDTTTP